ncbi:Tad domain-containing protein [Tessaracoccus sp. MC1865]|uniref:Tad domain-containing protein n=1 Tax=Tessaracoccus sp. MC1865 TaxID=2760310 RepID=UPI0015FF9BF4|nr:Tad domain-containing protein [Tessaracoccus sp. MC1865]MBB1484594.1 Tad domain-containing protein [Tessaracoccus sp. MC1865]QTO38318.1 Tad domain-containing protein [Tessaracoccus sp. MC1865]
MKADDRGATAVVVALVLVVLMGFGALAVDVGALWWDRKQLQNGADSAALALAQSCATAAGCEPDSTATWYAEHNKSDANVTADVVHATSSVTVRVETVRDHFLAPVLDSSGAFDSSAVSAAATASWGPPSKAVTLPLTTSMCWFQYQTGSSAVSPPSTTAEFVIPLKSKSGSIADGGLVCGTHSAHNETAGGFGWLAPDSGCETTIDLKDPWVATDPGGSIPNGCVIETVLNVGDTVLMPLFDAWKGTGRNAQYHVYVFAALEVTGYCFGPGNSSSPGWPDCQSLTLDPKDKGQNLRGRFVEMVELKDVLEYGSPSSPPPNAGAVGVRLTE